MEQHLNFERQYALSLQNILNNGVRTSNRTGIDTIAVQHQYFLLSDVKNNFPLIRGKKVFPRLPLIELMWFFNGRTDVKWLQERGVNYWNEWTNEAGTIGPSYGQQFRFQGFENSNFGQIDCSKKVDPLMNLINEMIKTPESRRLILNLWNHRDLPEMNLPPCQYDYHFSCVPINGLGNHFYVDLHVTQRSGDMFLGIPMDFMLVAYFLEFLSSYVSVKTGNHFISRDIHYTIHDVHIYVNHIDQVNQYLKNVEENQNNVIDSKSSLHVDNCFDFIYTTFDEWLKANDDTKYAGVVINKQIPDVYGKIEAPIAV